MANISDQVEKLRADLHALGEDLRETDKALRTEFKSWGLRSGATALRQTAKQLQELGDTAVGQVNELNTKVLEKVGNSKERAEQAATLLGQVADRAQGALAKLESGQVPARSIGNMSPLVRTVAAIAVVATGVVILKKLCRKS
ncbi:hypothetical protein HLH36_01285 [Gluconacetobacter aggeris]|uniref:Uncharacterized protein n=1 Tax=Gluconacetobacter aggeris TaxID=1286186 RepID=A0A7W4IQ36_9PROT|nr:hypothetical protein [Gluconacetobacter aggeris]MBB2167000.1 hypothetical protein [Gluconacetobacter aggeris]